MYATVAPISCTYTITSELDPTPWHTAPGIHLSSSFDSLGCLYPNRTVPAWVRDHFPGVVCPYPFRILLGHAFYRHRFGQVLH